MSQLDEQFDPRLLAALEQIKTVSPRNPGAAARGRAIFLANAQSLPGLADSLAHRGIHSRNNLFSWRLSFAALLNVLLILGLLVGVTGTTVYAAQDSLPNTPLYAVKISSEDIQTALAFQPEVKLRLLISFADRRVDEIASLGLQGIPPPESVTSRLKQQWDQALELGAETSDPALVQVLVEIRAALQRQLQTVMLARSRGAELNQSILVQVQTSLEERLRLAESGMTDPAGFRLKIRGLGVPAPKGEESRTGATPTRQEYRPSATLPSQGVQPTATPAGVENVPTAAAPTQEIHLTVTPARQQVVMTTTPVQEVRPAATPAAQPIHPTTAPPAQDVHPAATSPGENVHPPLPPPTKGQHP